MDCREGGPYTVLPIRKDRLQAEPRSHAASAKFQR